MQPPRNGTPRLTRRSWMAPPRGFTLIETTIALSVMAVGLVGALAGLLSATQQLHDGQTQQYRSLLLDASAQRWTLGNKFSGAFVTAAQAIGSACGTTECSQLPIGSLPWGLDLSTNQNSDIYDISVGPYFQVNQDGQLVQVTIAGNPACGSIPTNVASNVGKTYCREWMVTKGPMPVVASRLNWPGTGTTPAWATALTTPTWATWPSGQVTPTMYTLWIRVSKDGDSVANAVYFSTNFIPPQ